MKKPPKKGPLVQTAERRRALLDEAYNEAATYRQLADGSADDIVAMGYRLTSQLAMLRGAILEGR